MKGFNITLPRLLLQFLIVVSCFISLGFTPSAWAVGYTLTASASPLAGGAVVPYGGSYLSGAKVTITATPKTGYKFGSWSGCSSSTTSCTVTMTSNKSVVASFVALPPVPQAPTLNSPANGATNVSQSNVTFSWSVANAAAAQVNNYRIVISQDSGFSGFNDTGTDTSSCNGTCFTTSTGTTTSYTKNMDLAGTTYYWKVRANGLGGVSPWSVTRSFTTAGSSLGTKVDSFVNKWKGKGTDLGGYKGNYQCVALMRQYLYDVFGYPTSVLPSSGSAYSIFANANDSRFVKILNTPSGIPQKGDIMFWYSTASNSYGHVAIFISGDTKSFTSLDQNWINSNINTGSPAAVVTHTYSNVAGWLHPR